MSSNLEFTTRAHTTCDGCGRPTQVGFYHLHRGTPVLFDCVPCVTRLVGAATVAEAVEAHKAAAFARMEAASEAAQGGQW
jgi:hypothetical protein